MKDPEFTLGVEEEYLLVDPDTCDLVEAPDGLMDACRDQLGDKVSPEFLRCQIEVGTGVCESVDDARRDLANLRRTIRDTCATFGVTPIAASTHPSARWDRQTFTDKDRYRALEADLAGVARRMLICGMHVHVGINDDDLRVDLMNQFSYFLPHLLALSTSSPFWEGTETGLHAYRLSVFDNMPRTGLPPRFDSFSQYDRAVKTLVATDVIEDSTKIWWDIRPSDRFPTVEVRICDVMPLIDDAMTITALIQSIMRMLYRLRRSNMRWRQYDRFLLSENRWRAQRYGVSKGLIDFGARSIVPFPDLVAELVDLIAEDAAALGCTDAVQRAFDIVKRGTSAQRQCATYHAAKDGGASTDDALKSVVKSLVGEFSKGL